MTTTLAFLLNFSPAVCFAQADGNSSPLPLQLLPIVAIAMAAYLILIRPERERQRKQQTLLAAIKKNDRVVTAGGLCGTVASVDREAGRVSLKVDESSNVKLTVTLASIAQLSPAGSDASESSA